MTAVLGDNSIKGTRMGLFEPGSDALKAARNRCSNAIAAFHALPEDAPAEQRGEFWNRPVFRLLLPKLC